MTPSRVAPVTVLSWLSGQGGQAVPPLAPLLLSVPPPCLTQGGKGLFLKIMGSTRTLKFAPPRHLRASYRTVFSEESV